MEQEYNDSFKTGFEEGYEEGYKEELEKSVMAMVKELQNYNFSQEKIIGSVMRQFHLDQDNAEEKVQKYWIRQ